MLMKYDTYPACDDPAIPDAEREMQSQFMLIEKIQKDLWGEPINDGSILKPTDPQLMMNWIAGGIFQYKPNNIISATYALSRPDDDPYVDDEGIKWSGIGFEYFVETSHKCDWAIGLLVHIASHIYAQNSAMMFPGMFIPAKAGFIPPEENPDELSLLCIIDRSIQMPDGRCDYLQFVPMNRDQYRQYMSLGDQKAQLARNGTLRMDLIDVSTNKQKH